MTNVQVLDNINHRDVVVIDEFSNALGDGLGSAMLVPTEVAEAQREFPLFFRKDPKTGQFFISALLGLKPDENLFINDAVWLCRYIPLVLKRGPFLIGSAKGAEKGSAPEQVIYINHDDPRVNGKDGKRLFADDGEQTPFAQQLYANLHSLHEGFRQGALVCQQLGDLGLIEPVSLDIVLDSGEAISLSGLFTVNQEKLIALDAEVLASLNGSGVLPLAYYIINSLGNVKFLIDLKNTKK